MKYKTHDTQRILTSICIILFAILAIAFIVVLMDGQGASKEAINDNAHEENLASKGISHPYGENDEAFINGDSPLVIANKKHKLRNGYEPSDLTTLTVDTAYGDVLMRKEAANAIAEMFKYANSAGVFPVVTTAYRNENFQSILYNKYVDSDGIAGADKYSSRPGYSDHQTGLAADISCSNLDFALTVDFENTPEGTWLAEHAHEFGFILRYPEGKEDVTGYKYEPWHFRYIGVEYATAMFEAGNKVSMEEFFEINGGDYE